MVESNGPQGSEAEIKTFPESLNVPLMASMDLSKILLDP